MNDLPKAFLTRTQLLEYLPQHGFPIGRSTLDKMCMPSRGEGPPVAAWWPGRGGNRPLYEPSAAMAWAKGLLKAGGEP